MNTLQSHGMASCFGRAGTLSRLGHWGTFLSILMACFALTARAQTFQVNSSPVSVAVAKGVNPLPIKLPIVAGPSGFDLGGLTAQSNSAWVLPTVDTSANALVLTFATDSLALGSTYMATITLSNGTHSAPITVTASVASLNVTVLRDDPTRSRTYAIHQNGLNAGAVLVFDPIAQTYVGSITVGLKPTDLAVSDDGSELLAICGVNQKIFTIDLATLAVSGAIPLPGYGEWDPNVTTADVAYGPANTLYYVDGSWAPVLRVLDRNTGTVIQTVTIDGNGFGDIVVSKDKSTLFGWVQYGWTAGWAGSYIAKYSINPNNRLTFVAKTADQYPTALSRDPLNTPAFISSDGNTLVIKQLAVSPSEISTNLSTFSGPVYAMSPNAEIVSTQSAIYQVSTGNKVYDLPVNSNVQAITSDYARLVYFDAPAKALKTVNLLQALGEAVLGRLTVPADEAITLSPASLQWASLPGVDGYQVYLGTSLNAVTQATSSSPEYRGQVTGTSLNLHYTLTPGTTYYWRVDAVSANDIAKGTVLSFTVATISSSLPKITTATVAGHAAHSVSVDLSSATSGKAWTATSADPWIKFDSTTGVTPATLKITLDASALTPGLHQGRVRITTNDSAFSLPVNLQVDPLALTVIRSDRASTKVYAISEAAAVSGGTSRAYLLEIDSLLKTITRVVPVGYGVTDLAIHRGDNRVYVTNWSLGSLLAVNIDTFSIERTYAVQPGGSYSENDAYRISAGGPGRLMIEAQDQWIKISLFNTTTGAVITSSSQREGGGAYDPQGRYYYHGDNNSSGSSLHKLNTAGDVISQAAAAQATGASGFGSRTVVMSEDGLRIFWNGIVFDQHLQPEWIPNDVIYSVSGDGRYAFSQTKIYDIAQKTVLQSMPVSTAVSAYNTATGRLVVQNGPALGFYNPVGPGLLGSEMSPAHQAVIESPSQLRWTPMLGATGYRVYLGTSSAAVAQATTTSSEYLGEITGASIPLNSPLTLDQTYYWRVDIVVNGAVVAGEVYTFFVAPLTPGVSAIDAKTVQGFDNHTVSLPLTSATPGLSWSAVSSASWVKLNNTTGVTPQPLQISLDASQLNTGLNEATITVTTSQGTLEVPVRLRVDPLTITVMRSARESPRVYAISESTNPTALGAYLLEIDTILQRITRVTPVGIGATDLAVHSAEYRVYVTNWKLGALIAVDINSFTVARTYAVPPFGSTGSGHTDVYRVSAGGQGKLIVEEQDQWINVSVFNTFTGAFEATMTQREGGGAGDSTGRYYYHGDNNSSGAKLRKLQTSGSPLLELTSTRGSVINAYGSRNVVLSSDNNRVFWNGSAYTADLVEEWAIGAEIYSTTHDGRFAFGSHSIYDLNSRTAIMPMPVVTTFSAYSHGGTLVVPQNGGLGFYRLNEGSGLPPPQLSVGTVTASSVQLKWSSGALESGSILQKRGLPDFEWSDVGTPLPPYTTTATVSGLTPETHYHFRVKAISPVATSGPWSNEVHAATLEGPPVFTTPTKLVVESRAPVDFQLSAHGTENVYTVTGLPPGMSFDASTGKITGSSSEIGRYVVALTVTNPRGSATLELELTIGALSENNSKGRYAGLVSSDAFLTGAWRLDRSGNAFTGTYSCSGGTLKLKGSFPASGDIRQTQINGLLQGSSVVINATWDRVIDRITFQVSARGNVVTTFEDTGFASSWDSRARPYSKSGLFNAVMLPSDDPTADKPEGYGFLGLTFTNTGTVQIQGETSLGGKITSSGVVLDNYNLPFYWKSGDSILWGIITTSSNNLGAPPILGSLGWATLSNPTRRTYSQGFVQGLDVLGSRFIPAKATTDLFKTSNTQVLQLGAGGMERMMEALVQPFGISGKKVILPVGNPYQMKLTLTPKTGLVTGSVVVTDPHPSGGAPLKRTVTFRGIMVRKTHAEGVDAVGGYFLMPDWNGNVRSGWMEVTAPTP